jgi:hypothetical protein
MRCDGTGTSQGGRKNAMILMRKAKRLRGASLLALLACAACSPDMVRTTQPTPAPESGSRSAAIWAPENLFAWAIVPYDARKRDPAERAAMLRRLGFTKFGYDGGEDRASEFDAELDALRANGVELVAWWFPYEADDPFAITVLEALQRHGAHPRLFVRLRPAAYPRTREEWTPFVPEGFRMPMSRNESAALSPADRQIAAAARAAFYRHDMPQTPAAQAARVEQEAARVEALAKLAARYGCRIALYNDAGWSAIPSN